VIASFHIADVDRRALGVLRARRAAAGVPGVRYLETAITAPLSGHLLHVPRFGRVGLIAGWEDEEALERFLAGTRLGVLFAGGWHVRMRPMRVSGAWSRWGGLPEEEQAMEDEEPAAVITLGRLRATQTLRFLRASAAAEGLAVADPAVVASTGLARPGLVGTFSLWRSTAAMRGYALGHSAPGHLAAIRAQNAKPFHHESAFIRFRPYSAQGLWDGREPLAIAQAAAVGVNGG
jgi:hypothetical protein